MFHVKHKTMLKIKNYLKINQKISKYICKNYKLNSALTNLNYFFTNNKKKVKK